MIIYDYLIIYLYIPYINIIYLYIPYTKKMILLKYLKI